MEETCKGTGRPATERVVRFLTRPVILIFLAGLIIRLLIAPFLSVSFDTYFWALIISNIQSGEGLYGLSGYYYTPVWGYMLGVLSVLQDVLIHVPVFGDRFMDALPMEAGGMADPFATLTSVAFNFSFKIILFIADIIVGYMIYSLIKDHTDDEKKATLGFALWFMCPITIVVSSVCGMFDAFSVLFMLSATILMLRSRYLLAGAMFSLSVLTKFFPVFFLAFFVAYILAKHKEDGTKWKRLMEAVIGAAVMALVIYIPVILTGGVIDSLSFITGRVESGSGASNQFGDLVGLIVSYGTVIAYIAIFVVTAYLAYRFYRKNDTSIGNIMMYMLMIVTVIFLYPPAPQYVVLLLPFLIFHIIFSDRTMMRSWTLLSIFVTMHALGSLFAFLLSAGAYGGFLGTVVGLVEQYWALSIFGIRVELIYYVIAYIGQFASILSIIYFLNKGQSQPATPDHVVTDHTVNE